MDHRARTFGIATISAATLMFELVLTRLYAVVEWHHMAFVSISVALLGNGIGSAIASITGISKRALISWSAALYPLGIAFAYLALVHIPFDSYQLAWNAAQFGYLVAQTACMVIPFLLSGIVFAGSMVLADKSHRLYAASLLGSAFGSVGPLVLLPTLGGERMIIATIWLGLVGVGLILTSTHESHMLERVLLWGIAMCTLFMSVYAFTALPPWTRLRMSSYKALSQMHRMREAQITYDAWHVHARITVVEGAAVHSAPGLSLQYRGAIPPQAGLLIDGDTLSPITRRTEPQDSDMLRYLATSPAYALHPHPTVLIIRPRGGLAIAQALGVGARQVDVIEDLAAVTRVLNIYRDLHGNMLDDPRVKVCNIGVRTAMAAAPATNAYELLDIPLTDPYRPTAWGAYSLAENYVYTTEAMRNALETLTPNGILVVTRWLQDPPSESLRAGALLVEALEQNHLMPASDHLIAYRSWSTMTILARRAPWPANEAQRIYDHCQTLGYDLVWGPGVAREMTNRHNILPSPLYAEAFAQLIDPDQRAALYRESGHDIRPPTDDRPFFGHTFRWRQMGTVLSQLGEQWQPFGGSGFLIIVVLLGIACIVCGLALFVPLAMETGRAGMKRLPHHKEIRHVLLYYATLGLGFMLIEIPLMGQIIRLLGHSTLSFAIVLLALLLASGIGSMVASKLTLDRWLLTLSLTIATYAAGFDRLCDLALATALPTRITITIATLLPLGFVMGVPFAGGLATLGQPYQRWIPWIMAINGSASVVGSVLATMVALCWGYRCVWGMALICYAGGTLCFWPILRGKRGVSETS